jgi:hypothetical protein
LHNPFVYNGEIGYPQFLQENNTYFVRLGEPKFLRPQVSAQRVDLGPFHFGANVSPNGAMSLRVSALFGALLAAAVLTVLAALGC